MPDSNFNIIKPVAGSHNSIPSDRVKRDKKHNSREQKKDKENEEETNEKKVSENESESAEEEKRGYNNNRTNRLDFRA
jgi:hypothetical protein